jgi:replicative DNA helicase
MKPLVKDFFREIEKRYDSRLRQFRVKDCRLANLVYQMLNPVEVSWLFAEPQAGTTAFFIKMLEEYCHYGLPVLFSSSKIDRVEFVSRLTASYTKLPLSTIQRGSLSQKHFPTLITCGSHLQEQEIFFSNEHNLDSLKVQQKMRLWKNKEKRRGIFLYDDYCEMEEIDIPKLEGLRNHLKKTAIDCNVPIIAHVKINSMQDFFNKIKPCQNMNRFSRLHKAGANIFLAKNLSSVDALFLSETIGWKNVCFTRLHDTETLDYFL